MKGIVRAVVVPAAIILFAGCGSSESGDGSGDGIDVIHGDGGATEDVAQTDAEQLDAGGRDTGEDTGGGPAICGNGIAESGEACDGDDTRGLGCTAVGFTGGTLGCRVDCAAFDTGACSNECVPDCSSVECGLDPVCGTLCATCPEGATCNDAGQCDDVEAACGNGAREPGELCDGADVGTSSCEGLGFEGGELTCGLDCQSYDFDACTGEVEATCGNDTREPGELCDGTDLAGADCTDFAFDTGVLQCAADCASYTFGGCSDVVTADCGNGVREAGEICDRGDLGGNSCVSLGYDRGALACAADCGSLVTTGCASDCVPACGARECGPDPTCGISCGACGPGESCSSGTCLSDGPRGPRIITFNTNSLDITSGESVIFTAVVTDPDGIDDVIGGTLIDPATSRSYGSFATSASEGAYSLTLSWADIHRVRAINFTSVDEERTFRASFYDVAGDTATAEVALTLTCDGDGACDGVCTDLTTTANCGSCGTVCTGSGRICSGGACACPAGRGFCGGACVALDTLSNCGSCGNACVGGEYCAGADCACYAGETFCGGACEYASTTTHCGAGGCTACGANQTCNDNRCADPIDGSLRLNGDNSILQVSYNGTWYSVCDDAFFPENGVVACRQMGMGYVSNRSGQTATSAGWRLGEMACDGDERSLASCYNNYAWDPDSCFNSEHVSLTCNPNVVPTAAVCPPRPAGTVVLNEVMFNPTGADGTGAAEFVELYGTTSLMLNNYSLVGYDGATGSEYFRLPLDGLQVLTPGFSVIGGSSITSANMRIPVELQNGPDSIRLEYCDGTIVDALAYGTFAPGTTARGEGTPEAAPATETSLIRLSDGVDTNNNSADWGPAGTPTPRATNTPFTLPITRTGTVTSSSPTFIRPSSGCVAGSGSTYYETVSITNTGASAISVTATATWTSGVDGYLFAYNGPFTPTSPTTNCAGADDDYTSTGNSQVIISGWGVGQTYTFVMSSYDYGTPVGGYSLTIAGP